MLTIYTSASECDRQAIIGYTSYQDHEKCDEQLRLVTPTSATIAEMLSVLFALKQYPDTAIHFYSTSNYVVNVLKGTYQAKKERELWSQTIALFHKNHCQITYVDKENRNERTNAIRKQVKQTLRQINK